MTAAVGQVFQVGNDFLILPLPGQLSGPDGLEGFWSSLAGGLKSVGKGIASAAGTVLPIAGGLVGGPAGAALGAAAGGAIGAIAKGKKGKAAVDKMLREGILTPGASNRREIETLRAQQAQARALAVQKSGDRSKLYWTLGGLGAAGIGAAVLLSKKSRRAA